MNILNKKILYAVFCLLLVVVCFVVFRDNSPRIILPEGSIEDELVFPQDLMAYIDDNTNTLLFTLEQSLVATEEFKTQLLSSWNYTLPEMGSLIYYLDFFETNRANKGYRENLKPWTDKEWNTLAQNANYSNFPSMAQDAITIRRTSVRLAPTQNPNFKSVDIPGNSYPFDEFQQSALALGSPVTILHISKDKQWYFIGTSLFSGWVESKDIAFVDDDFYETWHNSSFAAIIEEDIFLENGEKVNIGTVLPLANSTTNTTVPAKLLLDAELSAELSLATTLPVTELSTEPLPTKFLPDLANLPEDKINILLPIRSESAYAQIKEISLSQTQVIAMPMPFTSKNMAIMGNKFMNQPYAWGGLYGNRDCSSMLKDLFTPFGIWIPRNSKAQANAGTYIDISDKSNSEKYKSILSDAIPFQTFIYLPGHIGLYVGNVDGNIAMFHNTFGVRTRNNDRLVIGKTLVTSLEPAKEFSEVGRNLIDRITAISIINPENVSAL